MQKGLILVLPAAFALVLGACALGSSGDTLGTGQLPTQPEADASNDGSSGSSGSSGTDYTTHYPDGGSKADASKDAASDGSHAGDGSTTMPPNNTCKTTSDCNDVAEDMGWVAGDVSFTGSNSVTTTGRTNGFYKVSLHEQAIGVNMPLIAAISLDSTGTDFDLYVYKDASCSSPDSSSTAKNGTDVASISFDDDPNTTGDADDVYIEVRAADGATCTSASSWTLTVKGASATP